MLAKVLKNANVSPTYPMHRYTASISTYWYDFWKGSTSSLKRYCFGYPHISAPQSKSSLGTPVSGPMFVINSTYIFFLMHTFHRLTCNKCLPSNVIVDFLTKAVVYRKLNKKQYFKYNPTTKVFLCLSKKFNVEVAKSNCSIISVSWKIRIAHIRMNWRILEWSNVSMFMNMMWSHPSPQRAGLISCLNYWRLFKYKKQNKKVESNCEPPQNNT